MKPESSQLHLTAPGPGDGLVFTSQILHPSALLLKECNLAFIWREYLLKEASWAVFALNLPVSLAATDLHSLVITLPCLLCAWKCFRTERDPSKSHLLHNLSVESGNPNYPNSKTGLMNQKSSPVSLCLNPLNLRHLKFLRVIFTFVSHLVTNDPAIWSNLNIRT